MKKPIIWVFGTGDYSYRVQFDFVDASGTLLKTKTWEVKRQKDQSPQVLFLQAAAQVRAQKPDWEDVAINFLKITIPVESLTGELTTTSFAGFLDQGDMHQILAAAPLTISAVVEDSGVHLSLYTARIKK